MMLVRFLSCTLLAILVLAARAEEDISRFPVSLARMIRAIRPADREQKWKQIPWLTDLDEGIVCAKKEKRPLFLWVAGDEPLDRC